MTCTVMLCSLLPVLGVKSDVDNFEELIELNNDKKKNCSVQYLSHSCGTSSYVREVELLLGSNNQGG